MVSRWPFLLHLKSLLVQTISSQKMIEHNTIYITFIIICTIRDMESFLIVPVESGQSNFVFFLISTLSISSAHRCSIRSFILIWDTDVFSNDERQWIIALFYPRLVLSLIKPSFPCSMSVLRKSDDSADQGRIQHLRIGGATTSFQNVPTTALLHEIKRGGVLHVGVPPWVRHWALAI